MEKKFLMQILQPHIHQNGCALAEYGRKPSIASANKEGSTILSSRSLRTELSVDKNYYRNVFIIFSLHTEMDENQCTNANYTDCASVFIHFCMQRKNNENIPCNLITN